ncbi:MAG: Rieske (2Fe-2S) protein [Microlunatus sp.]
MTASDYCYSCDRRTALRAAGLVALSGSIMLAGCNAQPSGGAGGQSASGGGSATAGPASVAIADVAVGGGVVVNQQYVVTQPTDGEFKAFSAICTHQGCVIGSVSDGVIICPCHNSHFDLTSGDPVAGPATEPLPAVSFTKSGSDIVIKA